MHLLVGYTMDLSSLLWACRLTTLSDNGIIKGYTLRALNRLLSLLKSSKRPRFVRTRPHWYTQWI